MMYSQVALSSLVDKAGKHELRCERNAVALKRLADPTNALGVAGWVAPEGVADIDDLNVR